MSSGYVFDTEAIIAFLCNEPGHEAVADLFDEGFTATLTDSLDASEVFYLVVRLEGVDNVPTDTSLQDADRDIRALEQQGLSIGSADWRLAAEVKADGSISLADAYAVALAHERDAALVAGADDDFDEISVEVDRHRFRDHGV